MKEIYFKVVIFICVLSSGIISAQNKYFWHKASSGENIEKISVAYGLDSEMLKDINPVFQNKFVENDDWLIIPLDEDKIRSLKEPRFYLPQKKIKLKTLAKRQKIPYKTLVKLNPSIKKRAYPGDSVKLKENRFDKIVDLSRELEIHKIKPSETIWRLAHDSGLNVKSLIKLNSLKSDSLKIGQELFVPIEKKVKIDFSKYFVYEVKPKESMYGLQRKYSVPKEVLLEHNPSLKDGLKSGMILKIPLDYKKEELEEEEEGVVKEELIKKKNIKLSLLLPYMADSLDESNILTKFKFKHSLESIVSDFHLATKMAIDELNNQGLEIDFVPFDTYGDNQTGRIRSILDSQSFNDVDICIGPLFLNNNKSAARILSKRNIPLISPLSSKPHDVGPKSTLIQIMPPNDIYAERIISHVAENYEDQNLIVVCDNSVESKRYLNRALHEFNSKGFVFETDSTSLLKKIKPVEDKAFVHKDSLFNAIQPKLNNWVLMLSDDPTVNSDIISNFGILPDSISVKLFTLKKDSHFDNFNQEHLRRVNMHFASVQHIDYSNNKYKTIFNSSIEKYNINPSEYFILCYDVVYDALLRMAISDNRFLNNIHKFTSSRISCDFQYEFNRGVYVNQALKIISYEGYKLTEVPK